MRPRRARQPSWLDHEPGMREFRRQLAFLWATARRRWFLVLAAAVLVSAGLGARKYRSVRKFPAKIVLRVIEQTTLDEDDVAPPVNSQVRGYIQNIALSRSALLDVMKKHGLYKSELNIDQELAVATMRDDIDVEVAQNYFSRVRYSDSDPARSARIIMKYWHEDPDLALLVVQDLGHLIGEEHRRARSLAAKSTAASFGEATAALREQLYAAEAEVAKLSYGDTDDPTNAVLGRVRRRNLAARVKSLEADLEQAEHRRGNIDMRAQFEEGEMGLMFEIVDRGRAPEVKLTHRQYVFALTISTFLALLPVLALAIGALDFRVWSRTSLARLGLRPLGHVPRFKGDTLGTLRSRPPTTLTAPQT